MPCYFLQCNFSTSIDGLLLNIIIYEVTKPTIAILPVNK